MSTAKPHRSATPSPFARSLRAVIEAALYHRRFHELTGLGVPDEVASNMAISYARRSAARRCARRLAERAAAQAAPMQQQVAA